jgi:hypothetical protein
MVRRRKPPSQTWRTFLENHFKDLVSVDFFTVPIIRFQILYVFWFWPTIAAASRMQCHRSADGHVAAHTKSTQMSLSTGGAKAGNRCKPHIHV